MKIPKLAAVATTALGLALALSVPSQAEALGSSAKAMRTEVVKYNDLNLGSAAGAATLYSRLKTAVWHVCRDTVPVSSGNRFEHSACLRDLMEKAVRDVDTPTLTALHERRAAPGLTARR